MKTLIPGREAQPNEFTLAEQPAEANTPHAQREPDHASVNVSTVSSDAAPMAADELQMADVGEGVPSEVLPHQTRPANTVTANSE